jgi:hypothetical protein
MTLPTWEVPLRRSNHQGSNDPESQEEQSYHEWSMYSG